MGSGTRSPNRKGKISFGQKVQHKGMICTIVIALYCLQVFNPIQHWVEGVFIPPTLLQYSRNAPPVTTKVLRLHQGYSVISPGKTVRIGHSYSSHMQHGAWQPSAGFVMFRLSRSSPPCRALSPRGPGRHLRVHDPDEFAKTFAARERLSSLDELLEPSPTGSNCRPCSHR